MDSNMLCDVRYAAICGMLFTTVVAMTAESPAAVPNVFLRIWHRYRSYQEMRKASGTSKEKFWEIDMTKFEP